MIKFCKICKSEFKGFKSDERHKRGKYCSRKCFWIGYKIDYPRGNVVGLHWKHTKEYKKKLSLARMGKNNPMYRTGLSKSRNAKTQRIKKWRMSVLKRDDYTCQECSKRGGELNAHHIKFWCFFPKERFKVSNGVTLCKECHRYVHWLNKYINGWEKIQKDMIQEHLEAELNS